MEKENLVVFIVNNQRFAIHLSKVDTIVQMVEIDPLPLAPDYITGTINFHGEIIPVLDMRKVFLLPNKEAELSDQLIVTKTYNKTVALWVDSVSDVVEQVENEIFITEKVLLENKHVKGYFKLETFIVMIHDLDKFLTPEQIFKITEAIKNLKDKEHQEL